MMMLSKNRIGGLLFLALSIGYGYSATSIPLFPGEELEPVSARSLPYVLAILGGLLSLALLLFDKGDDPAQSEQLSDLDWRLAASLLLLMIAYGLALEWLGFLLATLVFLMCGFWLLGERRPKVLLGVAVPFTVGFWALLTQALDIYLAPGSLMHLLGG